MHFAIFDDAQSMLTLIIQPIIQSNPINLIRVHDLLNYQLTSMMHRPQLYTSFGLMGLQCKNVV